MTWTVEVSNVAGILSGSATLSPGQNAVRASNWQGKSSFVAAIRAALGVSRDLTEGREQGTVRLETPDRTVRVDLRRGPEGVDRRGEPYLTDEYDVARASLFACLDERNDLRRAVREGDNLEDVLMRPLDFQNIDERIADLRGERDRVESELAGAETARERLPAVERKVSRLESELADTRERYERLTADDEAGGDGPSTGATAATDAASGELAEARAALDRAEGRVDRLERSVDRLESQLADKRAALEALDPPPETDVEAELAAARERHQERKRDVEVVQSLYAATERVVTEDRLDLVVDVERELTGDTFACWTCGGNASRSDVEAQLETLGDQVRSLRAAAEREREEVERLEARREEVQRRRRRERELRSTVAELEESLADDRRSLAEARDRRDAAADRVEDLTTAVDETVAEVTDVESELKYRKAELADARDEREALAERAERADRLAGRREEILGQLEALRGRKDEVRREARAAFDEAMGEILARFDTGFETARLTADFELIVARDGREASLDALSRGELELLGFVAALAGHETFDVAETVPVMLVDGVGDLADDNLHTLVEILRDRAEYLVFTVYPEYDSFDGHEIDPGDWVLATDAEPTAE
jgi:DNA repair exonuclease SbcCD ATPase subunit